MVPLFAEGIQRLVELRFAPGAAGVPLRGDGGSVPFLEVLGVVVRTLERRDLLFEVNRPRSDAADRAQAAAQAGSAENELPTRLVNMSYFASTARNRSATSARAGNVAISSASKRAASRSIGSGAEGWRGADGVAATTNTMAIATTITKSS